MEMIYLNAHYSVLWEFGNKASVSFLQQLDLINKNKI